MYKALLVVVILGGIIGLTYKSSNTMEKTGEVMAVEDKMMEKDESMTGEDKMMMKAGSYIPYSADKLAMAESSDVVLFFRASWCPTCKTLDEDIKANLDKIPETLTILDVDYDNSTALKQKYGVTYQHTLVQVDAAGNQIKKWSGGSTLNSLVSQVQ